MLTSTPWVLFNNGIDIRSVLKKDEIVKKCIEFSEKCRVFNFFLSFFLCLEGTC